MVAAFEKPLPLDSIKDTFFPDNRFFSFDYDSTLHPRNSIGRTMEAAKALATFIDSIWGEASVD